MRTKQTRTLKTRPLKHRFCEVPDCTTDISHRPPLARFCVPHAKARDKMHKQNYNNKRKKGQKLLSPRQLATANEVDAALEAAGKRDMPKRSLRKRALEEIKNNSTVPPPELAQLLLSGVEEAFMTSEGNSLPPVPPGVRRVIYHYTPAGKLAEVIFQYEF